LRSPKNERKKVNKKNYGKNFSRVIGASLFNTV
jgi:hypothetical protein